MHKLLNYKILVVINVNVQLLTDVLFIINELNNCPESLNCDGNVILILLDKGIY
jgi:hypothetical protein